MNPWVILAILIAIAGAGVRGYQAGEESATNASKAEALKVERKARADYVAGVKRAVEQANQIAEQNAQADGASVQRRAEIRRVFQTIDHEVIKYVQTDAGRGLCFDDVGLRLYNAANRGEPADDKTATGAGGHGAVPGTPAPGGERQSGGGSADQQDDGAGILPVPGSTAGAGGLDTAQP